MVPRLQRHCHQGSHVRSDDAFTFPEDVVSRCILHQHGKVVLDDVISHGGYQTTLIDATLDYLRKVISRSHDPDYLQGSLEDYVGDSVNKGWVSIWWAYHEPHKANLVKVSEALRNERLPDLTK